MLCRRCKTAVPDKAQTCPYCGVKLRSVERYKAMTAGAAVLITVALVAFPLYISSRDGSEKAQPTPVPAAPPSSVVVIATQQPAPTNDIVENVQQPVPTSDANLERDLADVQALLEDVVRATQLYYDKYNEQTDFVSKNGFLYEFSINEYIQPHSIWDVTDLNPEYKNENVLILYIKSEDLRPYSQLSIGSGNGLEIYAAYEVKDGFAICSAASSGGVIFREELKAVLDKYNSSNGDIVRFKKDSQQAYEILYALAVHTGVEAFDVRYMAGDERFAAAVVSPKGMPVDINEYVLENINGRWTVMVSNYEKEWKYRNKVSQEVPAMDSAILPRYNLYSDAKFLRSDFTWLDEASRKAGFITNMTGTLEFTSGNDEFVYMEYSSGEKYLGNYREQEAEWVMYAIADYKEGEQTMKMHSRFTQPPYYLLKQF